MKYADQIRGRDLQIQCPHCGDWNDWGGDYAEGREDLECGHCRRSYMMTEGVIDIDKMEVVQ